MPLLSLEDLCHKISDSNGVVLVQVPYVIPGTAQNVRTSLRFVPPSCRGLSGLEIPYVDTTFLGAASNDVPVIQGVVVIGQQRINQNGFNFTLRQARYDESLLANAATALFTSGKLRASVQDYIGTLLEAYKKGNVRLAEKLVQPWNHKPIYTTGENRLKLREVIGMAQREIATTYVYHLFHRFLDQGKPFARSIPEDSPISTLAIAVEPSTFYDGIKSFAGRCSPNQIKLQTKN